MSHETMKKIAEAEESARLARQDAQAGAKNMIAEAEKSGQTALSEAVQRAEEEAKRRLKAADEKAEKNAAELMSAALKQQEDIRRLAESRLDDAAGIVVERIVNG